MPLEIGAAAVPVATENRAPGLARRRFSVRERTFFTERLALLLESGVALHAALATLESQAASPALKRVVGELKTDITEGRLLSHALSRHPEAFSATYVNLIAAAENGGFLPAVLKQLIDLDEKAERVRSTIVSALAYPAFLTLFSFVVLGIVLVYVFPQFAELFANLGDRLPATTAALMGTSNVLRHHWPWLAAGVAAAAYGVSLWVKQPAVRAGLDRILLETPGLNVLTVEIYLLQALRILALSLGNGVALVPALAASREVAANSVFRRFLVDVERQVAEGQGIAAGFETASFIPPLARQMIATGEQTGSLGMVLGKLADFYQRDLERRINLLARLAEPVMLALMGGMVGVIVSALLLPIFRLSGTVH